MSKHTPGPWRVVLGPQADSHLEIHGGNGYVGLAFLGTFDDGSLGEANAILIAAAPDLLKVLRPLVDRHCYEHCGETLHTPRCKDAKRVIAKAEDK